MSHEPKRKHRGWDIVNPNAPQFRPFQVGTTVREFDTLVAIALAMGINPRRLGRTPGQSAYIVEMIRMIARGQLVVVRPATEEPRF